VIGLTAFNEAWTLLKATVQEMRNYEPTDEEMDRYYNFGDAFSPTAPKGYTITPEDKEKHKQELDKFEEDLANQASRYYSPDDYNPPKTVFRNLAMKYGTPRIGPIQNPEDRHSRVMQDVLRQMASMEKEGY